MPISADEASRTLYSLIQQVSYGGVAVEISSPDGDAVLLSADEYAALQAAAFLLRSPKNGQRLYTAYTEAQAGINVTVREVSDLAAAMGDGE